MFFLFFNVELFFMAKTDGEDELNSKKYRSMSAQLLWDWKYPIEDSGNEPFLDFTWPLALVSRAKDRLRV